MENIDNRVEKTRLPHNKDRVDAIPFEPWTKQLGAGEACTQVVEAAVNDDGDPLVSLLALFEPILWKVEADLFHRGGRIFNIDGHLLGPPVVAEDQRMLRGRFCIPCILLGRRFRCRHRRLRRWQGRRREGAAQRMRPCGWSTE